MISMCPNKSLKHPASTLKTHINILNHHKSVYIPVCNSSMKCSFDLPTCISISIKRKKQKQTARLGIHLFLTKTNILKKLVT